MASASRAAWPLTRPLARAAARGAFLAGAAVSILAMEFPEPTLSGGSDPRKAFVRRPSIQLMIATDPPFKRQRGSVRPGSREPVKFQGGWTRAPGTQVAVRAV